VGLSQIFLPIFLQVVSLRSEAGRGYEQMKYDHRRKGSIKYQPTPTPFIKFAF
jgi:hypothetical protein